MERIYKAMRAINPNTSNVKSAPHQLSTIYPNLTQTHISRVQKHLPEAGEREREREREREEERGRTSGFETHPSATNTYPKPNPRLRATKPKVAVRLHPYPKPKPHRAPCDLKLNKICNSFQIRSIIIIIFLLS